MLVAIAGTAQAQSKVRLLVKQGDPAPGGGTFDATFGVTLAGPEGFAVFDGIANGQRGIWMSDGATTTKIVRHGDPVPPGVPGTVYGDQTWPAALEPLNADNLGNVVFAYVGSRVLHTPGGVSVLPSDTGPYDFALKNGRIAIKRYVTHDGHYVSRGPVGGPYTEFYTHNMTIGGFAFGHDKAGNFGALRLLMDDAGTVPAPVMVRGPIGSCASGSYLFPLLGAPSLIQATYSSCYPGFPFPSGTPSWSAWPLVNGVGQFADSYMMWLPDPEQLSAATRNGAVVLVHPRDTEGFLPPGRTFTTDSSGRMPYPLMLADDGTYVVFLSTNISPLLLAIHADGGLSSVVPHGQPLEQLPTHSIVGGNSVGGNSEDGTLLLNITAQNSMGQNVAARGVWTPRDGYRTLFVLGQFIIDQNTSEQYELLDAYFYNSWVAGPGVASSASSSSQIFASLQLRRTVPPFDTFGAIGMFDLNDLVYTPCPSDVNGDTDSDILDFLDFFDSFGTCQNQPAPCAGSSGIEADYNGDTFVDILDFLDFFDAFGIGC